MGYGNPWEGILASLPKNKLKTIMVSTGRSHAHLNFLFSPLVFEFLLLDVFLLNVPHHFATTQEVVFQVMRNSLGNFDELIVNHRAPRNLTTRRNHVSAPLIDKSE